MTGHGKVGRHDGQWVIVCTPPVRLRLKRVFERIQKSSHAHQVLSDTPENARELAWFLTRFPMDLTAPDRRYLEARAAEYDTMQTRIAAVLSTGFAPRPFQLAVPARDYQAVAAELALRSGSLLVADDVGLGKTATSIAMLTDLDTRPALVVTLVHLQRQWLAEFAKFAPGLDVHILRKSRPYPLDPMPPVLISSYAKLSGWADTLAPHLRGLIFDEVQELRRMDSDKYRAAHHLATHVRYRLGLSATPIYNYGAEMFSVLDVLAPGALGTLHEFEREWCEGQAVKVADPRAFGHYLRERGLMIRRTRAEVGRELPPVSQVVHEVDVDQAVLDSVAEQAVAMAQTVLGREESYRGEKLRAAEELSMVLRQATGLAKAPHVAAFVKLLCEGGERVVLYGWHHEVYARWRTLLADLHPVFFTGTESPTQKEASKQAFLAGTAKVLIISLRAGAGLDGLQVASRTVVFGELDWTPGVHEQCVGRIARDGQAEPVMAYYLVADSGSDPVVVDVLGLKRQQSEAIRDPAAALVDRLQADRDHIKRLASAYLVQRNVTFLPIPEPVGA